MPGLSSSRWAPSSVRGPSNTAFHTPRSTTVHQYQSNSGYSTPAAKVAGVPSANLSAPATRAPSPTLSGAAHELGRYLKIVARLKWKTHFLAEAYRLATNHGNATPAELAEAEIMFKIDFYEFYMHIERAMVHLMAVFGWVVFSRYTDVVFHSKGNGNINAINGSDKSFPGQQAQHRFHANVLEALDNPENPLHEALGTGEVRGQLARAKDLRNRWKNADRLEEEVGRRIPIAPLESYDLERILECIFEGFDKAYLLADQYVQELAKASDGNPISPQTQEEDWGFMVDAMDWEAV